MHDEPAHEHWNQTNPLSTPQSEHATPLALVHEGFEGVEGHC
jgi:hypothetical protein